MEVSLPLFDIFTAQLNPKSQNNKDAPKNQRKAEARVIRRSAVTQSTPQSCIMRCVGQILRFFSIFLMLELPTGDCGPIRLLLMIGRHKVGVVFNGMMFIANFTEDFRYFKKFLGVGGT
jgi:hypothetical protein